MSSEEDTIRVLKKYTDAEFMAEYESWSVNTFDLRGIDELLADAGWTYNEWVTHRWNIRSRI